MYFIYLRLIKSDIDLIVYLKRRIFVYKQNIKSLKISNNIIKMNLQSLNVKLNNHQSALTNNRLI